MHDYTPVVTDRASRYLDRLPQPAVFYDVDSTEGLIRDLLQHILRDGYEETIDGLESALDDMESEKEDLEARCELVTNRLASLWGVLKVGPDASFEDVLARAKALAAGTQ